MPATSFASGLRCGVDDVPILLRSLSGNGDAVARFVTRDRRRLILFVDALRLQAVTAGLYFRAGTCRGFQGAHDCIGFSCVLLLRVERVSGLCDDGNRQNRRVRLRLNDRIADNNHARNASIARFRR